MSGKRGIMLFEDQDGTLWLPLGETGISLLIVLLDRMTIARCGKTKGTGRIHLRLNDAIGWYEKELCDPYSEKDRRRYENNLGVLKDLRDQAGQPVGGAGAVGV